MKKIKPILFAFILMILFTFCITCNKSSDSSGSNKFTWTFEGTTYNATLDSAFTSPGFSYNIIAIIGTDFRTNYSQLVIFNLFSITPGNLNIGSSSGNTLYYVDAMAYNHYGLSGTLNITSNANNRLSGNFSVIVNGPSGNVPFSGSFTNVPVN